MRMATPTWAASTEPGPSTGNSFSTTFSFGIGFHQLHHVGHGAFAIAAIVVEEFDHGDIAVPGADGDAARRFEDRVLILGYSRGMLLGLGGGLALAELGHRLFQHLGMLEQIIPDDGFDIAALDVGKTLRGGRRRRPAECEREQGGGEQAERAHGQILLDELIG